MKKGKLEVQEDQEDQGELLPILGPLSQQKKLCHDNVSLALCRDRVLRPGAQPGLGVRNKHASMIVQLVFVVELSGSVLRQGSPFRDGVPKHIGKFGLQQDLGLG